MIFRRKVASPDRFAIHLPAGMKASTLEQAARELEQRFGAPAPPTRSGEYDEIRFTLEDRDVWFYRDGGAYVAIRSAPKQRVQAFFRPCSGPGGSLTGTGSATGFAFNGAALLADATANALASVWALLPVACAICTPCICLPLAPYPSAVTVTGAGFLRMTVTVDMTAPIICV